MGNFGSNIYNPGIGNVIPKTNMDNLIMESFSSINNAVQTFNAFNMLINTAYGALYTSISTMAGITDQIHRTQTHLSQIIGSLNFFKIIKRFLLYLKRIFYGDLVIFHIKLNVIMINR